MHRKQLNPRQANVPQEKLEALNISLMKIMMADYEQHHYDKELLRQSAVNLGIIEVPVTDLEQMRVLINKYCSEQPDSPKLSPDWCFIDSCTAERFFRVDRAQENLHFITDIATDCVFVLDQESPTLPQTPEDDHRRLGAQGATVAGSLESSDGGAPPFSPQAGKLLDRSLSGPPGSGDIPSHKGSPGSHDADRIHPRAAVSHDSASIDQSLDQMVNFKSDFEEVLLPPIPKNSIFYPSLRSSISAGDSTSQAHTGSRAAAGQPSTSGHCPAASQAKPTRHSKSDPSSGQDSNSIINSFRARREACHDAHHSCTKC